MPSASPPNQPVPRCPVLLDRETPVLKNLRMTLCHPSAAGILILVAGMAHSRVSHAAAPPREPGAPVPLLRAHAHNDYEHTRPLLDALDRGFCSVEADVHLVDGRLLVAHDRWQVKPGRSLQALYLDPLRSRVRANGGRVYRDGPPVTLLIDVKSDANKTYAALRGVLEEYRDILTVFRPDSTETNAITVVITGNRARDLLAGEAIRYSALDGRLEDLDGRESNRLIPLISDSWESHFKWRGVGPISEQERTRLRELVKKTHAQGRRLRFWATADRVEVWSELSLGGVDLLNADDLDGLRQFLLKADLNRSLRN